MTELLPCPFCGGEASKSILYKRYLIECDYCGRYGHGAYVVERNEAEAIAAWNTRAERTCKWEYPQNVNGWVGYAVCSSCGEKYDESVIDSAYYCPNCGAKVVEK